jgi:sulfur carrier protein ThiS
MRVKEGAMRESTVRTPQRTLSQATIDEMALVIMDGDFLSLDSHIPDGARVDVLTPLTGGALGWSDACASL